MRGCVILSSLLLLGLVACKPQAKQEEVSQAKKPQVPSNPLVTRAQQTINNGKNQGRACLTFDMSGKFRSNEQNESVDYDRENSDLPAYKQWVYLAKRGVAMQQTKTLDGRTYDTFTPKRDLKDEDGQGIYIPDGRYLSYCYGRWTVTDAEKYSGSQYTPPSSDYEMLMITFQLTDAPDWAKSDPAANVLNELNGTSEDYGTLQPALNELNKAILAKLITVNKVPLAVLKK